MYAREARSYPDRIIYSNEISTWPPPVCSVVDQMSAMEARTYPDKIIYSSEISTLTPPVCSVVDQMPAMEARTYPDRIIYPSKISTWPPPVCSVVDQISSCSIAEKEESDAVAAAAAKKEKIFFGEEVIGKRIRIFREGWVVSIDTPIYKYAFEPEGSRGRALDILDIKDQMMELGIIEKEEDMIDKKIRVYDEGVIVDLLDDGMHCVLLEDGTYRALALHNQDEVGGVIWEWEWEWHIGKSQLPSIKRIWSKEEW